MDRSQVTRYALTALVLLMVVGAGAFAWIWFAPCWLGGCAPVDELAEYQAEGSQLLDMDGEPIGTLATVNRRLVSIDSLPLHVPRAFLAVEDQRFYDHGGIDLRRVGGALVSNVQAGGVAEGGSTITMQLARNLFPDWLPYQERSLRRKVMEARVARQIERSFSKDKILELYLNHIYLGEGAYGIEAAARTYFGKPARELSVAEAALLGGLPKAPSQINPVADPEAARERRDLVLTEMAEAGFVPAEEARAAREQPIQLAQSDDEQQGPRSSYFIEQVRREMEEVVGSRFYTAGLRIYTTMDLEAQQAAEDALARQLDAIEAGRYGAYRHGTYPEDREVARESGKTPYVQGAVVLMDARSGGVRALVGGRDFDDSKFNRATQALRQPGSAFKPFVYLTALEQYGSPVHVVEDAPIRMVMSGGRVWEPKNYTGSYDGPMTLRDALARSKNTVTVRLAQEVGTGAIIRNARRLGITGDIPETPAMALGTASVRPIELVRAYAAFANGGALVEPRYIERVEDRHGAVVWESSPQTERVLDPETAFVLTTMLQDVVDRGTGTAARAAGYRGPAAGKTGTTNDAADVWFIGYTPELVGGVWIGMDDPSTIVRGASGGTLAAPVWGRVMAAVYRDRPAPARWRPPSGVSTAQVERGTGVVVEDGCPARGPTYTEYFTRGVPAGASCQPSMIYPQIAAGDSAWQDEEWGADPIDSQYPEGDLGQSGIEWPELEELRRRGQVTEAAPPAGDAPQPAPGATPAPPEASPPAQARPEPPAQRPQPQQGPKLLGEPVRRDTTGRRPPPPDTMDGGR